MTVKEAIVRWNVTQSTVYSYLKDELVLGAEKKEVQWVIPDDALCPYKPTKSPMSQEEMIIFILRALNENKTIPPALLNLQPEKLSAVFKALEKQNYITKLDNVQHRDPFGRYLINLETTKTYLKPKQSLQKASELLLKFAPTLISLLQTIL